MTHYRQIILDLAVEDDTPDEKIKNLADKIKENVVKETDAEFIKEVIVHVN